MFSKASFSIFVAGVFVFGLALLSQPQTASAGFGAPVAPGCCITNGGQCSPSCGTEGTSCQNDGTSTGQCDGLLNPATCGGPKGEAENVDCYIEGDFCTQIANNAGVCGEAAPTPTGEPQPVCDIDSDCDDANICTDDTCINDGFACSSVFNAENDPSCVDPPSSTIVPTMGQWGMIITTIVIGFFAVLMLWKRKDSELS